MSDDKNNGNDDLAGLFSTRSSKKENINSPEKVTKIDKNISKVDSKNLPEVSSNNLTLTSKSNPGLRRSTGMKVPKKKLVRKSSVTLSPVASTVLRETRRELGSKVYANKSDQVHESTIITAVEKVIRARNATITDIEKANIVIHLQKDLLGWGVLEPLIANPEVTDIHCYDHQTVVLQRGKVSESTGIHWPNKAAYVSFIDRILMRLGKSLSTQQHTIDASFPDGTRICAVHDSVCGSRGPLLCIRVPRMTNASIESAINYQVGPELIIQYLASLTASGIVTMMLSGETGTGKTTLMKCLATRFGADESIVTVEDTPELNLQHKFFRSLVSRTANLEGKGEVTLSQHIMTTLRMTPTRVILGEMRTPESAEAFLEAAQTGHTGMSTVHARNARETLIRLESLLGRAQKSVSIEIIRQQIALAVDLVVWLVRDKELGKPRIAEIIEVGHYVEGAIQVKPIFTLQKGGKNPVWSVDSWSSNFDEYLARDGIYLGDAPKELTLQTEFKRNE